ncbi:MAG TPA: hypothetical protein PLD95_04025 [bacterium]|jgi:hypothetical protein|nr:hypothetical protein [bacterium]
MKKTKNKKVYYCQLFNTEFPVFYYNGIECKLFESGWGGGNIEKVSGESFELSEIKDDDISAQCDPEPDGKYPIIFIDYENIDKMSSICLDCIYSQGGPFKTKCKHYVSWSD